MGKKNQWTGERLETFIYADTAVDHLHRYAMALMLSEGKTVVDIASGEGYGSAILATKAATVIGVDIDAQAVAQASKKYRRNNLEYRTGSAAAMPIDDQSVDVLVSFETIEHHDQHEEMFREIRRVLKPGGLLIMSSPDKKYYTDIPKRNNPFHIKELYLEEFEALSRQYFPHADIYLQRGFNGSSIIAATQEFLSTQVFTGDFDAIGKKELLPLYNIVVASDNPLPKIPLFLFDGEVIINKMQKESVDYVRNSTSFRLGNSLLSPFIFIKRLIHK
ncbi:class I SAM-dependent methyltransferase [Flavobacterium silvaticum]|uniref:Class I SAM-dependent methyltransferase n=1 Tax=Flavobacterium silvaticum TaxID=1852020 RepID=A0A972JGX0_9FLAO|nr:class I SAM-dependent methyltransferase [Flavobacterium silvaticum]NMH29489.1 class I SAM-dependent methyltransferase [Flavobacterium silvaticum]